MPPAVSLARSVSASARRLFWMWRDGPATRTSRSSGDATTGVRTTGISGTILQHAQG